MLLAWTYFHTINVRLEIVAAAVPLVPFIALFLAGRIGYPVKFSNSAAYQKCHCEQHEHCFLHSQDLRSHNSFLVLPV
jgi:hypothetical protein